MIDISTEKPFIRLMAGEKSWIEGDALRQLETAAGLAGVDTAIGLPDLHPGQGIPVGAAFLINNMIYPHLVGGDVGCGIGLFRTGLPSKKLKTDKWLRRLTGLEQPWQGDGREWLVRHGLSEERWDPALGTIGGGNHFVELQRIESIFDRDAALGIGLDPARLFMLIHSGSRGLGSLLLRRHTDRLGAAGLPADTDDANNYLQLHDDAIQWACASRSLIAHRFADRLGTSVDMTLDHCHNSVTPLTGNDGCVRWLHRKGAVPADAGAVVIPGSRGTLSYLVRPRGDQHKNLFSLAHGAGRRWNRASCKGRLKAKFNAASLTRTQLGGTVICDDKTLLYEEAPQAYKNIDAVIDDMRREGVIEVIATLRPLITYKVRNTT